MRSRSSVVAAIVLTLVTVAVTSAVRAEEPAAPRRIIGLGWNAAAGVLAGDGDASPAWEAASFEVRLFPGERFSIDLQWDVIGMVRQRAESGAGVYMQQTYFHVHHTPDRRASLAVAPYVLTHIGAASGATLGRIGAGARVGVDLLAPGRTFGLGVYARPGFVVAGVAGARPAAGFAAVVEITWTFYPRRRSSPEE